MPRRREVQRRELLPDTKFNDVTVTKFLNAIMRKGKKGAAEHIVYGALSIIEEKTKEPPLKVFKQALSNLRPLVEVKSRRVGGATYQVPIDVSAGRGQSLAMRWIIQAAKSKRGKSMKEKFAQELLDASRKEGVAMKKRTDTHRMAEANKAFAHYRW